MIKRIVFLIFIPWLAAGQVADTMITGMLDEVLLSDMRPVRYLPWTYQKDTLSAGDTYQNSVKNVFDRLPGVQSFNGENFAQDVRIAIRGYGSRSAFGIRGIRIFQDGIPLTSPDGTSQLDELSIYDISELDVVRSGLAARLGNAGGGAISMKSPAFKRGMSINTRFNSLGSYDAGVTYGTSKGRLENLLSVHHHTFRSKRDYAGAQNNTLYNKTRFAVNNQWQLDFINSLYYSPEGNDPGALNANEFLNNKYQANARNVMFKAGESVGGLLSAVKSIYSPSENATWITSVFYRKRVFTGRLPFEAGGWVDLNRDFLGINNAWEYRAFKNSIFTLGQSAEYQDDRRRLYRNLNGTKGSSTADQNESVINLALYQQWQLNLSGFSFHQLLRYDHNVYRLIDHFLSDGNQDGQKKYNRLNGALGVGYHFNKTMVTYANISTSFEMPALNELTNNLTGTGGFNTSLNPESSVQTELGIKISPSTQLECSAAVFYIAISDQIQGYELAATPGRTYYRNAPTGSRAGVEMAIKWQPAEWMQADINYTFADYRYTTFTTDLADFSGNRQPLIPHHKLNVNLTMDIQQWVMLQILASSNSRMWLDDANLVETKPYSEINFVLSSGSKLSKRLTIGLLGNNVLNLTEYSNFRTNAAGQRYYEAASPMHFGVFLKARLF
jgi:iron complex outermembrane receptor protein